MTPSLRQAVVCVVAGLLLTIAVLISIGEILP